MPDVNCGSEDKNWRRREYDDGKIADKILSAELLFLEGVKSASVPT